MNNGSDGRLDLLLVEDDEDFGNALMPRLEKRGFEVTLAVTAEEALAAMKDRDFGVVVADIRLPEMDGMEFLTRVRELENDVPVILLTGYGSLESAQEAVRLEAADYLLKPLENLEDLLDPIHKAIYNYRLRLENRRLLKELVEAGENERQRIGGDLHDGVCQYLSGLSLMSKELAESLKARSAPETENAQELSRFLGNVTGEVRSLAAGLCPVTLKAGGLTGALEGLAADAEKVFGIRCTAACGRDADVGDADTATHLYRIAQEAVSNAVRHGKATEVAVTLRSLEGGRVVLRVENDGMDYVNGGDEATGMGMRIMRHRARLMGAELAIGPSEGGGTVLTCLL